MDPIEPFSLSNVADLFPSANMRYVAFDLNTLSFQLRLSSQFSYALRACEDFKSKEMSGFKV